MRNAAFAVVLVVASLSLEGCCLLCDPFFRTCSDIAAIGMNDERGAPAPAEVTVASTRSASTSTAMAH